MKKLFTAAAAVSLAFAATACPVADGPDDGISRQKLFFVDAQDTSRAVSCYRIPAITTAPDGSGEGGGLSRRAVGL